MKIPVDPLPHVRISGTSRECGVSLGNTIRNRIEHSLRTYQRTFELCDMSWAAATDKASGCREIVEQYCPHLLAELEGLADGSGIDEESLFTLNCRTEILPSNFLARAMAKDTTDNHSVNSTNKQTNNSLAIRITCRQMSARHLRSQLNNHLFGWLRTGTGSACNEMHWRS